MPIATKYFEKLLSSPIVPDHITTTISTTSPATMCFQKNHQCGFRSRTSVSPSLMSFGGYGGIRRAFWWARFRSRQAVSQAFGSVLGGGPGRTPRRSRRFAAPRRERGRAAVGDPGAGGTGKAPRAHAADRVAGRDRSNRAVALAGAHVHPQGGRRAARPAAPPRHPRRPDRGHVSRSRARTAPSAPRTPLDA